MKYLNDLHTASLKSARLNSMFFQVAGESSCYVARVFLTKLCSWENSSVSVTSVLFDTFGTNMPV